MTPEECGHAAARIRKLVALGSSPNPHEAASALDKAGDALWSTSLLEDAPALAGELAAELEAARAALDARPPQPAAPPARRTPAALERARAATLLRELSDDHEMVALWLEHGATREAWPQGVSV